MAKKKEKRQFAVIGLGRFGGAVTRALYESGADVLAIDTDEEKVAAIRNYATESAIADASDEKVLEKLGINNFDVVIVSIGTHIEASIFVTLLCKQAGVKKIIAKAQDEMHKEVLKKVGADMVVIPEDDMGRKLAAILFKPNIIEVASITEDFNVVEIVTPLKWQHKTLMELDLRNVYKITIMTIKRGDEVITTPGGECMLLPDDILMIAGNQASLRKLESKATKDIPQEEI